MPNPFNDTDGSYGLSVIGDAIESLNADPKLRMFYSTACYVSELAEEMVDHGFSVGAGNLDINTKSTIKFPVFLKNWAAMIPFGVALGDAFTRSRWRVRDASVRAFTKGDRFEDTNSVKETFGDRAINIRSNAEF